MKLAETPEEQRQWMAQWRGAVTTLAEARHRDLSGISDEEARRRSEDVLSMPEPWRRPGEAGAGLVEQQRCFARWPRS